MILNSCVLPYPSRLQSSPAYSLRSPSIRGHGHVVVILHLVDIMATSRRRPSDDDNLFSAPNTIQTTHPSFRSPPANSPMTTPQRQRVPRKKPAVQLSPSMPTSEELRNFRTLPEQFISDLRDLDSRLSRSQHLYSMPTPNKQSTKQKQKQVSPSLPRHSTSTLSPPKLTPNPPVLTPYHPITNPQYLQSMGGFPSPSPQYHQVKTVPVFTGREGSAVCIDDWIRDTKYLINSTSMPAYMQFSTIVRYLGGAARKLVLNLPPKQQTTNDAFSELRAQYGEVSLFGDPLADFYERVRQANESPTIYAVELEATLRTVEERMNNRNPLPSRNRMLTQQFMRGVRDERVTQRLAPMKPREMTCRDL